MPLADTLVSPLNVASEARDRFYRVQESLGHALRRELADSKSSLEDRLGRLVPGLAYPFGYSDAQVRRITREVGHRYACAVGNAAVRRAWDPFAVPRLTIRRSTRLQTFDQIIRARRVPLIFLKDRAMTKGWSVARRGRAVLSEVARGA